MLAVLRKVSVNKDNDNDAGGTFARAFAGSAGTVLGVGLAAVTCYAAAWTIMGALEAYEERQRR